MKFRKGEIPNADAFIKANFDRLIEWQIGDIKKCCRMKDDGTCNDNGALVGAFTLWVCAIDYFGGLFTGIVSQGGTEARFRGFIQKYMPKYDWEKVVELRWSLTHFYSPHFFALYHENNLDQNKDLHLQSTNRGIRLHLGWAVKDLEDGVMQFYEELKDSNTMKVIAFRYYKEHLPIMPIKAEDLIPQPTFNSLPSTVAIQSVPASGTVSLEEILKK